MSLHDFGLYMAIFCAGVLVGAFWILYTFRREIRFRDGLIADLTRR